MTIEIRQVIVKSVVGGPEDEPLSATASHPDELRIKDEILSECRQLVLELIRASRER